MSSSMPPDLYQVYFETSAVVDLDPNEKRNKWASELIKLIRKYRTDLPRIEVLTSQWAFAEARSVFYKKELENRGVQPPTRYGGNLGDIRSIYPPNTDALHSAEKRLQDAITTLESLGVTVIEPDAEVWRFVNRIGKESAIFPADSVHLATALLSGASMLVATDFDFIDKVNWARDAVTAIRYEALPDVFAELPVFTVCCLGYEKSRRDRQQQAYKPAIAHLRDLGFSPK